MISVGEVFVKGAVGGRKEGGKTVTGMDDGDRQARWSGRGVPSKVWFSYRKVPL